MQTVSVFVRDILALGDILMLRSGANEVISQDSKT